MVDIHADTAVYMVGFQDRERRREFVKTFESFLERYPFGRLERDTVAEAVVIRLLPVTKKVEVDTVPAESIGIAAVSRGDFVESVIETVTPPPPFMPGFGGSVAIYSDRALWDDHLAELTRAYPFALPPPSMPIAALEDTAVSDSAVSGLEPLLEARQVGDTRIMLRVREGLKNAAGEPVSAFDIVEQWTAYTKAHPAEGLALFRHVKGIMQFIEGREAVIPGFAVSGKNMISISLAQPDPNALVRLSTSRLLPAGLKLGPYAPKRGQGKEYLLVANRTAPGHPPYLEKASVVLGADKNPFLSYSLKKYDYMVLTRREDVEYARSKLTADSRLIPLQPDRYFLSIQSPDAGVRAFLAQRIDPAQVLGTAVRADGTVIGAVESEHASAQDGADKPVSPPSELITVVYLKGDPVSSRIAERLLADMAHAGVRCKLKGLAPREYEMALVSRSYTIAVGWIGARVLGEPSERLRLATIWFGGNTDEAQRIADGSEVPLFAVRRHVLCRNQIEFAGDTIRGMFVERAQTREEQQAHE